MKFNNQVAVLSNFSNINETLSVPLVANAAKVYFGNYQRLQDTLLQRFEVIANTNLTLAADGTSTLVSIANLDKLYLYLLDKNGNVLVDGIPLSKFKVDTTSTANNSFSVFPGFDNVDVDWQKSYIAIDATTLASISGQTIQVELQYMWKPGTSEFESRYRQYCDRMRNYNDVINRIRQQYQLPATKVTD